MIHPEAAKRMTLVVGIPIAASLFTWWILLIHPGFLSLLSFQNRLHLSLAITVAAFSVLAKEKNILDWIVVAILIKIITTGPLKALYYNFYFYEMQNFLFTCLLLCFVWILAGKTMRISRWYGVFTGIFLLIVQIIGFGIMEYCPSDWLVRVEQGVRRVDFFSVFYTINSFLQALAILIPSLFIISSTYIKNKSTTTIHQRQIIEFAGIFTISLVGLVKTIFIFERYTSGWSHSLLEVIGFIPLLFWFIAFRIEKEEFQKNNSPILWAIQCSLFLPLVYLFMSKPEIQTFLVVAAILVFLEIVLILFVGLVSLWAEVNRQGLLLREMGEYLTRLWGREEESFIITTSDGKVIDASKSLSELAGNGLQGKNIADVLRNRKELSSILNEKVLPERVWLTSNDGNRHPITVHSRMFDGRPEALTINILRDQHRFEQKQKANQQMQEEVLRLQKMESVIRMGSDIAHNFNNFLNGINAYSEMIRMHLNNDDYMMVRKYVPGLFEELSRAAEYVQKVIDATMSENPRIEQIQLQHILDESLLLIMRVVDREMYTFSVDIEETCYRVLGNSKDFTEIFFQLIWNAVEAMPDGGTISITTKMLTPEKKEVGGDKIDYPMVQVSVSDTGMGIDPETKEQIFDPFFSTKNKVGKGLGLTIAYALAKRHKGTILWANNTIRGVTFTVNLPAIPDYSMISMDIMSEH